MTHVYSIAEARDNLARAVHEAEEGRLVEIHRRGKPVAVLLSATDYLRLTQPRADFGRAVRDFRRVHEVVLAGLEPETFDDLRDPHPGRKVPF